MGVRSVIAAAAVLAALGGCGGGGGGDVRSADGLPKVLGAVSQTLAAKTALANLTLDGADALGAAGKPVYGRTAFIFDSGLGYGALAVPNPRGGDPVKAHLVFRPHRVDLLPIKGVTLPRGKLWLSAKAGKKAPPPDVARFLTQAESMNLHFFLNEILWGASRVESQGDQVVRHVPLSRYRVTIDLKRALDAAEATSPAMAVAIRAQLRALRARGSTTVPITVLVDAGGRIAQLEAAVPQSGFGKATMRMGFGVGLETSVPLEAQTVDLATQPAARSPWRPAT
jgi:hypothetical protein